MEGFFSAKEFCQRPKYYKYCGVWFNMGALEEDWILESDRPNPLTEIEKRDNDG